MICIKMYTRLGSKCQIVANRLRQEATKWQSHHLATSAALSTSSSKHITSTLAVGEGSSVGTTAEFSRLFQGCNRHCSWQIGSQGNCQSSHLLQLKWQDANRRHYCTQPSGEGSGPTSTTQVARDSAGSQLSQKEKLKRAVKEYGSTVIIFHITISLASLGGFYLAVSSGIDMVGILKSVGVGEAILQSKLATGTGTFVVAYAVHKVFAPVRIGITLTSTPFIVRFLRSKGILKPPKTNL